MVKPAPIIFGLVLILVWVVLTLKRSKIQSPSDLSLLQSNLIMIIENASLRTALLTAGLISIAFGL